MNEPQHSRSGKLEIRTHTAAVGAADSLIDVLVVELRGELRLGKESDLLGSVLRKQIDGGRQRILLDFSGLAVLDSTGVGVLVEAKVHALHSEGSMRLCNCPSFATRLLYRLALHRILEVYETEEAALHQWH